jgi:hypothetical protein
MQPATRRALDNRADPPYLKPLLIVTLASEVHLNCRSAARRLGCGSPTARAAAPPR